MPVNTGNRLQVGSDILRGEGPLSTVDSTDRRNTQKTFPGRAAGCQIALH